MPKTWLQSDHIVAHQMLENMPLRGSAWQPCGSSPRHGSPSPLRVSLHSPRWTPELSSPSLAHCPLSRSDLSPLSMPRADAAIAGNLSSCHRCSLASGLPLLRLATPLTSPVGATAPTPSAPLAATAALRQSRSAAIAAART